MDYFLVILGFFFLILGLVGCFAPIIPGPPLSFLGLLFLHWTKFGDFSSNILWMFAILTVLVTIIDYFIPLWGTRKWGGSGAGVTGATVGLVLGFFFPPMGIILGPFIGAVVGELIVGKKSHEALRSGLGAFIGFVLGTAIKLSLVFVMVYYFIAELLR
jgi:uncharacterized protein YqgC (DUF456 family)